MASLTAPRFLSPPSLFPNTTTTTPAVSLLRTPFRFHRPLLLSRSSKLKLKAKAKADDAESGGNGAAVLWFKHDLRVDDHPGLVAACKHPIFVPIYVFDHRILSRFSDEMMELVLLAVKDLRRSLKEQGSNLMIRFGQAENILLELVKEIKATNIFAEEEVEYDLCSLIDIVEEALPADPVLGWKPKVTLWRTPFYDIKDLDSLPLFYGDLKKPQVSDISLLNTPRLPSYDIELNWGHLPSKDDVGKFLNSRSTREKENWYSIKHISADAVFKKDHMKLAGSHGPVVGESSISKLGGKSQNRDQMWRKRLKNSVFGTSKGSTVAGGTKVVLNALAAYLRYLEVTARDDWQE